MKKEILADNIIVYRNAIPNNDKIIKALKDFNMWDKWYDVGYQINIPAPEPDFFFGAYPTKTDWDARTHLWKKSHFFRNHPQMFDVFSWPELEQVFYETTSDYLSLFPVEDAPNWCRGGVDILKYEAKKEGEITQEASGTENYALPFHTDFHYQTEDKPGVKPSITVTMYFNEDYDGGDIEYRIFDRSFTSFRIEGENMIDLDNNDSIVPGFNYKPQAGDIIIFPSKLPYYHGVKKVTGGQKLFLRTFWMYNKE